MTEKRENRRKIESEMREGAGGWRRHKKNSEHIGKTNQRVNPDLSKNIILFVPYRFCFIEMRRGKFAAKHASDRHFLVDYFFPLIL